VCCHVVNKKLAPASYIFFFVLACRDGQDVSIYGCMCIDNLILVYRLCNIFSGPITKGSDN
jgi:hypothetical protein